MKISSFFIILMLAGVLLVSGCAGVKGVDVSPFAKLTNLFDITTRIAVESDIDPWEVFATWEMTDVFPCPEGDMDIHIVVANPDPAAEIDKVELVIGIGGILPFGTLCSFSYVKGDVWHMFYYDPAEKGFVKYVGPPEGGHGGSIFKNKKAGDFI